MIEITKEKDEIKIVKSYKKIIKYSQAFMIFVILLFSFITFKLSEMIFNPISAIFFIYLILFSFFAISYEKITIKENYILLEAIRNNKRICYSQKISLDEINKIYFKTSFFGGRSNLLTYSATFDKYLKIETTEKTYSFGKEIDYEDYLKINRALTEKVREYKAEKIILYKERNREEELEAMYNLGVEERYIEILNAIIDEEKLFISKKEENFLIDIIDDKSKEFEEINFYVFYVNYLSKKEYENKKVLVGYNGVDGKEVTMSKLKEDINKLRDDRSTFK
ncbi:hypothetical protein [Fusobacterium pseudoperiodonticum]|uniref:Uncharacterized protein n=1 Tax=Fusobacterium pseudoperiodonticum TaxID=2663009 RepID=A0A2D3NUU5_9FUSO|nr:hypothetical protein [Fusobacterium pseudoperiodonticum]ATV59183.1 hypothetical protein CTM72_05075 [Fusobacterium pseudoperiodonticum]